MNIGRLTMLSICQEMDVKGTMSGKHRVWNADGRPCDLLGWTLQRLGYRAHHDMHNSYTPENKFFDTYFELWELLEIPGGSHGIIGEIDRPNSTNATIMKKVQEVFARYPERT